MINFGNEIYDVESKWYYAQDIQEGDVIFYRTPNTSFPRAFTVVDKQESCDKFTNRTTEMLGLRSVTATNPATLSTILVLDSNEKLLVLVTRKVIK